MMIKDIIRSYTDSRAVPFEPYRDTTPYEREEGFYRDMFGLKTRASFLPSHDFEILSGGLPGDRNLDFLPMHDHVELGSMIKAVMAANGIFTVLEMGAAFGPWIALGSKLASHHGLDYRLIAVEGTSSHFANLKLNMDDNHIPKDKYRLIHGVVSDKDEVLNFPKLAVAGNDFGASLDRAAASNDVEAVQSYTIASILAKEPLVDIAHCDIQGHEVVTLSAASDILNKRVRRIVVGTHGRKIEEQLFDLFFANGWVLEMDLACAIQGGDGVARLHQDGAQLWLNPRLISV